jgi:hypothetical protein
MYARVLDFCGLPATAEWIAQIVAANTYEKMKERGASPDPTTKLSEKRYHRGTAGGWREDLSAWDRFQFDQLAGDLLCELGYAQPGWWAESAGDRLALPLRHQWEKRRLFLRRLTNDARNFLRGYE